MPEWKIGTLKTPEYGYDFGHIIFYRPTSRKLSSENVHWVKFQGTNQIYSFTESQSGLNLNRIVAPMLDHKGGYRKVPIEATKNLNALLRTFIIRSTHSDLTHSSTSQR